MNYQVVSAKAIIAKVFRDLKPDNDSFVADALEWIGEALEYIGVHSGLEKFSEDMEIRNFRGSLPCDMHLIAMVEYQGLPLDYGSDIRLHNLSNDADSRMNPHVEAHVAAYFKSDIGGNQTGFHQVADHRNGTKQFYTLNPGVIQTSFESGTVRVYGMKLPTDEDNFPMVPDNQTTKEAITWYILRQMIMGGYKHPIFPFDFCDAKWEQYCGRAQNDLMFPSVDKVESFRNMWVSLIPNVNTYKEHFNY